MDSTKILLILLSIVAVGLAGCGGSSNSSPPTTTITTPEEEEENSGLAQRPPTAEFQLPLTRSTGEIAITAAFPNLPDFTAPVFATHSGDGSNRLFVVEQRGRIQVFALTPNPNEVTSYQTFLNIEDRVTSGGEMGLLGLAFDPNYSSNGYFYVYYTANSPRRSVVSRFQVSSGNADQANADSESVILEVTQPYSNHNGGTIAFGPDGYLYFGLGDGGSGGDPDGHGQNTQTLLGSMLRIDPQTNGYSVPADNPFVGNGDFQPEIWAYGLRNPYRFSFDRQTGDLWLADVGQGNLEEIDLINRGGNYGWNWYEGTEVYRSGAPAGTYLDPIFEYDHSVGLSITGGYVYRGSALPELVGQYIYGDFVNSQIWALTFNSSFEALENVQLVSSPQNVAGFAEDEAGELYIVGYGGTLYKLESGSGGDPIADFPSQLSETDLFADIASLTPASGLIEYDVNTPLWTDYAIKRRWLAVPNGSQIQFSGGNPWQFPVGSVLVKHFAMNMVEGDDNSVVQLETRILVHQQEGWIGVTYRWNDAQSDATLVTASATEELVVADTNFPDNQREQTYLYPGPSDCMGCHTEVAGRVLGVNTMQLNRNFDYSGTLANQLTTLNHIDLFSNDIGLAGDYDHFYGLDDSNVSLAQRSRDYLDANCAFCHQPGGPTPTTIDLRATTPLANTQLLDQDPNSGDLGIDGAKLIFPGDHQISILWQRMDVTDENRMPVVGSNIQDTEALSVVGDWIDSL